MGQVTHELDSAPKTTDAAQNSLGVAQVEENDKSHWNLRNQRCRQHFYPSQIAPKKNEVNVEPPSRI